jgi:hypothetical protein
LDFGFAILDRRDAPPSRQATKKDRRESAIDLMVVFAWNLAFPGRLRVLAVIIGAAGPDHYVRIKPLQQTNL